MAYALRNQPMCYGTVISLAILYVRIVTDASGRQAMDHSYDVIESSDTLIVHGQLMPFEHRPGPDLHVWNGMLNPRIVQVRGENCQFVTLESNPEKRWHLQTTTLKALAEWCIQCAPTIVPTIPRDPYPCMPTVPTDDKVATESGPNSVECRICHETECCARTLDNTFYVVTAVRGKRQGRAPIFVVFVDHGMSAQFAYHCNRGLLEGGLAVSTCPSQPWPVSWSRMSSATKANPCTNRPVNCPQCATTVWLYSVAAHFDAAHPNAPVPHHLCVPEEEEACVRKLDIGALKDITKK